MLVEAGQILILNMQVNNQGLVLNGHPYLVVFVNEINNYIEIAQVDSLAGKEYKAAKKSNKIIYYDNPVETVIDKDSYIQLDNSLRIEYFDELTVMRRQLDKLSDSKFADVQKAYIDYQENHQILENKQVYLSKQQVISLNSRLQNNI